MRILVTGAGGFVGPWLMRELSNAGHEAVAAPSSAELDLSVPAAGSRVAALVSSVQPDVIAHLAAISFSPAATLDPHRAFAVTVGGTERLVAALTARPERIPLLVTSSGDVYGAPTLSDLPLTEHAPLRGQTVYARSKIEQERVALAAGGRGVPVVVTRAFNHTGPGQRSDFVVPGLAERVDAVRRGLSPSVRVGNLDVRRDFTDVRDVVVAYRLLLEAMVEGRFQSHGAVFNVASGRSVSIRWILETLWWLAGLSGKPLVDVDPRLVRVGEPPEVRGDPSALTALTSWQARMTMDVTLRDLMASLVG